MSSTANNRPLSKEALAAIPVLRSLIISEKGTSTLKRILIDYAKEEGEPLPFRKFGFPSAVEYLKATDEFVLRTHMGETTIFVKPKADTAHIQKMVAAQKPAKVQVKRNPAYSWKNPQLRYSNQTGYMPKPWPVPKQYGVLQKNPNNPLKRFFPPNSTTCYPKISTGNENVPPRPSVPPKVVPSLAEPTVPYPKVVPAVKVEPRGTKPTAVSEPPPKMNENFPPLPLPANVTQHAYVRPMPNNNYFVKRETPVPSYHAMPSVPKNPCVVQNQNHFPSNPFQNERFVLQAMNNICNVQNQQINIPTNPFNGNVQCPPGFPYRQPTIPAKQFIPPSYNIPTQAQYQGQNAQYSSNPFSTTYSQLPPQQHQRQFPNNISNNTPRNPFAVLQPQQQTPPPPPPSSASSDQIIQLLDQQVQMLHDSVKSFQSSYKQSRTLLQTKLNQEVAMMEAIVRQYQQSVTDQQRSQAAAVDRLNQQLELLHATCVNQLGGGGRH